MSTLKSSNAYDMLDVDSEAPHADLKKAYRRRARETHPDHNGHESAGEFDAVQKAWEQICTPQKRAAYDRSLQQPASYSHPSYHSERDSYASKAEQTRRKEAYFQQKMRDLDEQMRRQREAERIRDEYRMKWEAEDAAREEATRASRTKTFGIFTINGEGISIMLPVLPKGYRLGAALVFTLVALIGLGAFVMANVVGGLSFFFPLFLSFVITVKIAAGTWYMPGMDKTAAHRVVGAAGTGFAFCLLTLLAVSLW